MFCPRCRDEFRPGFTRCAACDVDLVRDLSAAGSAGVVGQPAVPPPNPVRLTQYCGFLSLDDAREARDKLRERRIRSEIVLREAPGASFDEPVEEEAWLHVETSRLAEVGKILPEPVLAVGEDDLGEPAATCGECGASLRPETTACVNCGARFESD